jgi:chemotaxis signal transduction protein
MATDNTASYKDVTIPESLLGIINYMSGVEEYREELKTLGGQWDLLTILGKISGTGTDMTGTREGFLHLTNELLSQLGLENLRKAVQETGSKAQVAVDILIRNLFERTADIGFLATDDDVRNFIIKLEELKNTDPPEADSVNRTELRQSMTAAIQERFREYVAKYSVYFNIILLDLDGNVMAQLDQENKISKSSDPLIKEALTAKSDFVEIFRYSDMLPAQKKSLIYAYRVTKSNGSNSSPLGVLCLCFRFENEMEGIFAKLLKGRDDWSVITILDKDGAVIASSDKIQVPVGSSMEMVTGKEYGITKFGGRKYLAKTCATKGYQGFLGLGWHGHVMLPIEYAFNSEGFSEAKKNINPRILEAVMSDPRLFSEELRSIPVQADKIQGELERTVWNGNVKESDSRSKILLWSISDAGSKTKKVFEKSIGNLHETVVDSILGNVHFLAVLAVDIMDRNLYERANDCRWWALTSAFKQILSEGKVSSEDKAKISSILAYINGLYTVYTNLFVYDSTGKILAVSNPTEEYLSGTVLTKDWVRQTLALKDSQKYSVSPFTVSELYGDRHTYIYGAPIACTKDKKKTVGGIGIVFDSEPQFREMLNDSLPRDEKGNIKEGCFGIFADRNRNIISSSDSDFKTGGLLNIDRDFFTMPNGRGTSKIIEFRGCYYAVGAHTSSGYREYKCDDGYINDVVGLIFVPLANVNDSEKSVVRRREMSIQVNSEKNGGDCTEIATFYIGPKWLGIETCHIVEAIDPDGLTFVPGSSSFVKGRIIYHDVPLLVVDIRSILELPEKEVDAESQIIILKTEKDRFGLVVDALGEIPEIPNSRIEKTEHILENSKYTECIVKPDPKSNNREMLIVLRPEGIISRLRDLL